MNTKCDLCAAGFPLNGYIHYGTQSLGMIPDTRCKARPPLTELPWGILESKTLLHIEGPDGEHVCSLPKKGRAVAESIIKAHDRSLAATPTPDAGEDGELLEWMTNAHLSAEEYADLIECFKWAGKTYPDVRSALRAAKSNPPSAGAEGGKS